MGDAPPFQESAEELYEDAPCGYLSTSPDGTIQRANRTLLRWLGYDGAELIGRLRFSDLLPPGAKIYYETHYSPLLQMQGTVREIALELVRADGSRLPVLVNAVLKQDEAGQPLVVRITVFDASDRRRYERELVHARSEAEGRAAAALALEHVAEGVVLVDEDGRVRLLNHAAERIFGVKVDEIRGLPLTALSPDWQAVVARIPVVRRHALPPPSVVIPLTVGGRARWLAAAGESAQPEGIVYTLRDVTEERRLEEMRDDIVAIVSHELRTPLAGVFGAAQTLISLEGKLDAAQRRDMIQMIAEQAGRLTRIVEQILFTQSLTTGGVTADRRRFDVGEAVARVVTESRGWRNTRPVAFNRSTAAEVEGDPTLFEQALANLIDNAFKYSPSDTEVRVSVEQTRGHVRVTVADDGIGIPEEDRERIFEKFLRLDPEQATGTTGTGLGLYIARELVRRMNGRLGVLPAERGATFFVELPFHSDG